MKASLHRPTKAVIDLSAIAFNIEQIAAHIPRSVQKWAVVKANAYGHGAVPVSQHIQPLVDGFCVSNIDEALELREAGIAKPILILGVSSLEAVPLAIQNQITLTVASLAWRFISPKIPPCDAVAAVIAKQPSKQLAACKQQELW